MDNKNQNDFIEAIGLIDDEILEKAISYKKKESFLFNKKYMTVAASFLIVIISAIVGFTLLDNDYSTPAYDTSVSGNDLLKDENANGNSSELDADINLPAPDYDSEDSELVSRGESPAEDDESDAVREPATEDEPDESKTDIMPGFSLLPPLTEQVEIDDLNKLAYYSGWTMLRKYGVNNAKTVSVKKVAYDKVRLFDSVGYDVSEEDIPIGEKYEELIPVDPGFSEGDIAYAVYSITVNSVEYFRIQIVNDCFLAEQIGKGDVEVMILDVVFDGKINETMIVFKNGERYYSCLLDELTIDDSGVKNYVFTASSYVSNFYIVKMPELDIYNFSVKYSEYSSRYPQITFKFSDSVSFYVSSETYNNTKNVFVTNSAYGLTEELYDIYIKEVLAGEKEPELPEKPIIPVEPDTSEDNPSSETIIVNVAFNGSYTDKAYFTGENGYMLFGGGSAEMETLKEKMPNGELARQLDSIPAEMTYVAVWVKGTARFSEHQFFARGATVLEINFNYMIFKESEDDEYTLFLFELWEGAEISKIDIVYFNEVDYTTTITATFSTENEYDYSNDDEYTINFTKDALYYLYKNGVLIYKCEYKISAGYVVLCTDYDTYYLELSPVKTFVYEIDGRNRIFMIED